MKTKKQSIWKRIGTSAVFGLVTLVNQGCLESIAPKQSIPARQEVSMNQESVKPSLEETAQSSPIKVSSRTDYLSKYVFRGITFSEKPVVQHSVNVNYENLTFTGFWNLDAVTDKVNEEDLIIDYTSPINPEGDLLFSTGFGAYSFPNTDVKKTQEIYAGLSLDNEKLLNPSIFLFHDFKDGKGNYAEAGVLKNLNIGKIPLSISAKLGYNDNYYREDSGFSHSELSLAMPVELNKNLSVTPRISHSKSLDENDFESQTFFGFSLDYNF